MNWFDKLKWNGRRRWCWISSPDSTEHRIPSVLAVIETMSAIFLSIWLYFTFDRWLYMSIFISIAPILLLRNEVSDRVGFEWIRKLHNPGKESYSAMAGRHFIAPFIMAKAFLVFSLIRIISIGYSFGKSGVAVLSNIPKNWIRYSFCIDVMHPPEMFPGVECRAAANMEDEFVVCLTVGKLYQRYRTINKTAPFLLKVRRSIIYSLLFFLLFVPSIVYRWSIKSTGLVYLPFILLSKDISYGEVSMRIRLNWIREAVWKVYWSIFGIIILLTLLPIMIDTFTNYLSIITKQNPFLSPFMNYFVCSPRIERWNVARLSNGVITIVMYWIAGASLKSLDRDPAFENTVMANSIHGTLRVLNMIRAAGVYYVIICGLILFWSKVWVIDWVFPIIGDRWFPTISK